MTNRLQKTIIALVLVPDLMIVAIIVFALAFLLPVVAFINPGVINLKD